MAGHPIVHIELSSKDRAKDSKFYSDVFGWTMQEYPEMDYTTFEATGGPGGGFNPVRADNPAGTVLVYIDSDDIDADLEKIRKHGGKVLMGKTEIPNTGWFSLFEDPTGNKMALYTSMHQL